MDSLSKRAYDVYAQNLCVADKLTLIEKMQSEVDSQMQEWRECFANTVIHSDEYRLTTDAWKLSTEEPHLLIDDGWDCFKFRVNRDGKVSATIYDDNGCGYDCGEIDPDPSALHKWCMTNLRTHRSIEPFLKLFVETHPYRKK